MKNILDDFVSDGPLEEVKLDINMIKNYIHEYDSVKLCEMIVADRYFGMEEKISPICMEELAKRRMAGDPFNFETYIEQAHKSLPVLNFTMPDLRTVLAQAIAMKAKK
jgi:hypothetical protein